MTCIKLEKHEQYNKYKVKNQNCRITTDILYIRRSVLLLEYLYVARMEQKGNAFITYGQIFCKRDICKTAKRREFNNKVGIFLIN
jgi:hypothetical protein